MKVERLLPPPGVRVFCRSQDPTVKIHAYDLQLGAETAAVGISVVVAMISYSGVWSHNGFRCGSMWKSIDATSKWTFSFNVFLFQQFDAAALVRSVPRFGHGRGPLACVARNFAAKGLEPVQAQDDGTFIHWGCI